MGFLDNKFRPQSAQGVMYLTRVETRLISRKLIFYPKKREWTNSFQLFRDNQIFRNFPEHVFGYNPICISQQFTQPPPTPHGQNEKTNYSRCVCVYTTGGQTKLLLPSVLLF